MSIMIGNLILIADVVSRSHSISILVLFFITLIDEIAIKIARIHMSILLYLAIGIWILMGFSVLFVDIEGINSSVSVYVLMLILYR